MVCQSRQTRLETLEQDLVVNCVEGSREIEADQHSDLLVVGFSVHSVEDLQQRCFRQVSLPVCRLIFTKVG